MRALVSVGPPAASGTIMWMGRLGHACARAPRTAMAGAKIDAVDSLIRRRREIMAALRHLAAIIAAIDREGQAAGLRHADRPAQPYRMNRLRSAFLARSPMCLCT